MIAFDIDGCVNSIKEDIIRFGKDFFSNFPVIFNEGGYYLREIFQNAPESVYETFWQKYGYSIYTSPPLSGVRETIDYLKKHNIDDCYITSRDKQRTFQDMTLAHITNIWLRSYGILLPVHYCKDKVHIVKSLGVTAMVEDKPDAILKLQKITDVLIFKHSYNACIKGTFVTNWYEIMEILAQMYCDPNISAKTCPELI